MLWAGYCNWLQCGQSDLRGKCVDLKGHVTLFVWCILGTGWMLQKWWAICLASNGIVLSLFQKHHLQNNHLPSHLSTLKQKPLLKSTIWMTVSFYAVYLNILMFFTSGAQQGLNPRGMSRVPFSCHIRMNLNELMKFQCCHQTLRASSSNQGFDPYWVACCRVWVFLFLGFLFFFICFSKCNINIFIWEASLVMY